MSRTKVGEFDQDQTVATLYTLIHNSTHVQSQYSLCHGELYGQTPTLSLPRHQVLLSAVT